MTVVVNRWLAFDIGCLECGEPSRPIGLFPTEEEARAAADVAQKRQRADWLAANKQGRQHGQHAFVVFDLADMR